MRNTQALPPGGAPRRSAIDRHWAPAAAPPSDQTGRRARPPAEACGRSRCIRGALRARRESTAPLPPRPAAAGRPRRDSAGDARARHEVEARRRWPSPRAPIPAAQSFGRRREERSRGDPWSATRALRSALSRGRSAPERRAAASARRRASSPRDEEPRRHPPGQSFSTRRQTPPRRPSSQHRVARSRSPPAGPLRSSGPARAEGLAVLPPPRIAPGAPHSQARE